MLDRNKVVEELSLLRTDYSRNRSTPEERLKRFQQISKNLSSLLPPLSDNSLLDIDHLISTETNTLQAGKNVPSQDGKSFQSKCFPLFSYIYYETMFDFTCVVDTTYLQLIEQVSKKAFKEYCSGEQSIPKLITKLVAERDELLLIRAVKILKVSVDYHKDVILEEVNDEKAFHIFAFFWLSELSNIPQGSYDHERPITHWLSKQSTSIFKIIRIRNIGSKIFYSPLQHYFKNYYFSKESHYIKQLVKCFMKMPEITCMTFYFNHLFNYFLSVLNERHYKDNFAIERKTFAKIGDFFSGVYMAPYLFYESDQKRFSKLLPHQCKEIGMNIKYIVKHFMFHIGTIVRKMKYLPNTELRQLEVYCSYDTSLYVPKADSCKPYLNFKDKTDELMEKYFKNSKKSENFDGSNEKFLFECKKFSFFDDFMKSLQVIDVIHYALLTIEDRYQSKCLDQGLLTEVFRPYLSPIKSYINTLLSNPSMRGRVNWWIQVILRKCPFLIMSHHHESHIEHLIRMLKGKKIGKAVEDALYFVLNSKGYQKKWDEEIYRYDKSSFVNERNDFTDDDTEDENDNSADDEGSDIEDD